MPRPKPAVPLVKEYINLYKGDFHRMKELFPTLGAGPAIRQLVRNFIERVEKAQAPLDIDLGFENVEELLDD